MIPSAAGLLLDTSQTHEQLRNSHTATAAALSSDDAVDIRSEQREQKARRE
jgi:hypothetical protein